MDGEPGSKRCNIYVDGQNLFHHAKSAFGHSYPNYDIKLLAEHCCVQQTWQLNSIVFYTGIPDPLENLRWYRFWVAKQRQMGRQGIQCVTRTLRYIDEIVTLEDGTHYSVRVPREKGIDVRIAVDIIRGALRRDYDVALVFSQDQDLAEVAREIREIAREQGRWIKIASAYPYEAGKGTRKGINHTDWIPIKQADYDACLDTYDYLPIMDL